MNQSVVIENKSNVKKTHRPLVLATLVISMFMAAIEMTIISTAMPSIVGEMGGFTLYSWVFSAFSLMQAVTTPIYGKLSDLFGRKPIFITGIVIFLVGSILCGLSKTMMMLVIFRLIQGLGAGAVQPIAMTIVGDMFTVEERAKIQGYFSSVFGISSVIGPIVGGLIVQYSHWSWIFWMNVPLGILSIIGVVFFFHEGIDKQKHTIDYTGSILFVLTISSLMIALIQGGVAWSWTSPQMFCLLVVFIWGTWLFLKQERRASEPMMPLQLWQNRYIAVGNTATFTSGAIVIGLTSFIPAYIQGVTGGSAFIAGFTLTVMTVGWPIAAWAAGHLILKIGFRPTAVIGGIIIFIGSLFFITLDPSKGSLWAGTGSFMVGIGMGFSNSAFMISIQNSVQRQIRGVATASNMFMRLLGSSVGAALLGGILNFRFKRFVLSSDNTLGNTVSIDSINQVLDSSKTHQIPVRELHVIQQGLTIALHSVYWGVLVLAVITMLGTLFLPKTRNTA
ncbi:MFS transporter [Paenibacillus sp. CGMCC 1.16610]|uniref:MFS transporter n=1 Tax=Paenibacillus anseongense TaxID=2682845 RepID=A0ABW9UDS3_9BACL|nr:MULTISPECIES: MDR family MFS transporter [Paenibacillus]MBA2937477.1 MFS transporter [Paenibacillus sp. CGMCC 1.16610]MVQ36535.1 MFS transporter [Paenibacillus anseongense]